jgi:hypothetical protein
MKKIYTVGNEVNNMNGKDYIAAISPALKAALIQSTIVLLHEVIKVLEETNKKIMAPEH